MPFSFYVNVFVLVANCATVALIFYQGRLQQKAYREQDHINMVQHARISNLERHVLGGEGELKDRPNANLH